MGVLSINKKYELLTYEQNRTKDEACEKMNQFGKVMVERPTGFGKTRMLVNLLKEYAKKYPNKRIAYIYPLDIIVTEINGKTEYMKDGIIKKHVEFISYQKFTKKYNENGKDFWHDFFEDKYSIIMLDEVHSAGSEGFQNIYYSIADLIKPDGIHLIGVTATPNRMDDTNESSVLDNIFSGIQVYKFNLADCIKTGLIPKLIIATRQYDLKTLGKELKERVRSQCSQSNTSFDEKVFNIELGKLLKENGTEGDYIYKYLDKAGYNLASQDNKYFKFIVFFNGIQDMAERGIEVENWFDSAFNDIARSKKKLKKKFDINAYYVASSDTGESEIESLVSGNEHRFFFKKTKKLNDIEPDSFRVDLLFTVNMINMGYHVDGITGIMMLRGTRSEIVYYQQLGRAISVEAEHNPIIYDMVRNKDAKFWSKKDRKREVQLGILTAINGTRNERDYSDDLDIFAIGDDDESEDFMSRWSDVYYSEYAKILYMYEDRNAPICIIANELHKSCTEIAKMLVDKGIELRPEDAMYDYHFSIYKNERFDGSDRAKSRETIIYLYSRKADKFCRDIIKKTHNLYNKILKLK